MKTDDNINVVMHENTADNGGIPFLFFIFFKGLSILEIRILVFTRF